MKFSELKQNYQFLGDILNLYDKLDQDEVENDQYQDILKLCDIAPSLQDEPTGMYKKYCKKLLNNLLLLTQDDYGGVNFSKYCDILYMWMYFEINKNSIPYNIAQQLFNASAGMITSKLRNKTPCPYFMFNEKIQEPTKLMNLRIFNNNADTIRNLLMDHDKSKDCNLKKYVYECVDIYKKMIGSYGFSSDCSSRQQKNACEVIKEFNNLYMLYIYNKKEILHTFPELSSNNPTKDIEGCPSQAHTVDSALGETPQTDNSMKGVVSPALGFTPVRKFLSFRNKKTPRAFSNLGEEVENELIIQKFEDTKINSVHPKYNVGYGPV
ncbi:hypothetical protein PVIIG_05220 [Plasmodium vivax India VII]|uniref:VIR protein n=1 Tax=Plasmodium vivax India VII TaxID=1077284 RepID=A0A0J9UUB3_PLAVI|nr:hypothetical protein PVIIG_05220 [Plasmodium vivax India VII]